MAKVETLESIKARVDKIVEEVNIEHAACIRKYEESIKRKEEALEEAQEAYNAANTKAYHAAQDKIRESTDTANMFKDRADTIERSPYITQEEFNDIWNQINELQDKKVSEDMERLAGVFQVIKEIYDREDQEIGEINDFIKYLRLKVLKNMPGLTTGSGNFIEQPHKIEHYRNTRLYSYLGYIKDESIFKEILNTQAGGNE